MSEQTQAGGIPVFHIGDRLEKALDVAGVSHQAMADYLGCSRNTIGNYIALRSPVSIGTLRLWALKTGVPLEWIENGPGETAPTPPDGPRKSLENLTRAKRDRARATRDQGATGRYFRPSVLTTAA